MLAVAALALVAGCLRTTVTRCDNGAICPEGQACTEQASLCGPETRVEACAAKSEFDACDPNGTCHAGICDPCTDELAGCYAPNWRPMTSGTAKTLRGVWVFNAHDAYAVGDDGVALHYDGYAWSHITELETLTATSPLTGIWAAPAGGELFVLAGNRKVFHFDGSAWTEQTLASIRPLAAIGGSAGNDVYAAGLLGELWHYDGTAWSSINSGSTSEVYAGVWANSADDVYLVGSDAGDGIVRHGSGSTWQKDFTLPNNPLLAVRAVGAEIYAIGAADTATPLAHYTTTWMPVTTTANGAALWGVTRDDIFAAGPSGIYHYDGQAWDDRAGNNMPINAISGFVRDLTINVIAVGPNGSIWRLAR